MEFRRRCRPRLAYHQSPPAPLLAELPGSKGPNSSFSIHGEKNFPFHKEESDLDIALPDGSGDEPFLEALSCGLRKALPSAQAALAIYIAGADPFSGDRLGRLSLTKAGLAARDEMVFDACDRAGLPVAVVMGGGYAKQVSDTVDIHLQTIKTARHWASMV